MGESDSHNEIKEKIGKKYLRKTRKVLETRPTNYNITKCIVQILCNTFGNFPKLNKKIEKFRSINETLNDTTQNLDMIKRPLVDLKHRRLC